MSIRVPDTLTNKQIEEYQALHKKYHGTDISREDATEEGLRLMRFVALVIEDNPEFYD
jgi:predicted RNA polymerase sigma factor